MAGNDWDRRMTQEARMPHQPVNSKHLSGQLSETDAGSRTEVVRETEAIDQTLRKF